MEIGVLEESPVQWGYIIDGNPIANKEEMKSDVADISDEEMFPLSDALPTTLVTPPADDQHQKTDWVELVETADCIYANSERYGDGEELQRSRATGRCGSAIHTGVVQEPIVMRALMGKDVSRSGVSKSDAEEKKKRGGGACRSNTCKDYLRGVCKRGQDCWFDHPGATKERPNLRPVCKNYLNGRCVKSETPCKYRHVTQAEYDLEKEEKKRSSSIRRKISGESRRKKISDSDSGQRRGSN